MPRQSCIPRQPTSTLKQRRIALQTAVAEALRNGGNVLLPVDSAGRVLELIILLEDFWTSQPELARAHPLFLCGKEAPRMLEMAANNVVAMKRRIREREDSTRSERRLFLSVLFC